jgi:hypothetical protein
MDCIITWSIPPNIRLIYAFLGIFGWGRKTVLEASICVSPGKITTVGVLETQEERVSAPYDKRNSKHQKNVLVP